MTQTMTQTPVAPTQGRNPSTILYTQNGQPVDTEELVTNALAAITTRNLNDYSSPNSGKLQLPPNRSFPGKRLLVTLSVCVLVFLALLMFYNVVFLPWWTNTTDTWNYGTIRTSHLVAVVGDHDSPSNPTRFTAVNENGHVVIYELPGGDASKGRVYSGPVLFGDQKDHPVITLTTQRTKDGKINVLVHIEFQSDPLVLENTGSGFQWQKAA